MAAFSQDNQESQESQLPLHQHEGQHQHQLQHQHHHYRSDSDASTSSSPSSPLQFDSSSLVSASFNTFSCRWTLCSLQFNSSKDLLQHLYHFHVGRKSLNTLCLKCHWEGCSFLATKRDHITSHIKRHVSHRPYMCSFCSRSFKRPQDLKSHGKLHRFPNQVLDPFRNESFVPFSPSHSWNGSYLNLISQGSSSPSHEVSGKDLGSVDPSHPLAALSISEKLSISSRNQHQVADSSPTLFSDNSLPVNPTFSTSSSLETLGAKISMDSSYKVPEVPVHPPINPYLSMMNHSRPRNSHHRSVSDSSFAFPPDPNPLKNIIVPRFSESSPRLESQSQFSFSRFANPCDHGSQPDQLGQLGQISHRRSLSGTKRSIQELQHPYLKAAGNPIRRRTCGFLEGDPHSDSISLPLINSSISPISHPNSPDGFTPENSSSPLISSLKSPLSLSIGSQSHIFHSRSRSMHDFSHFQLNNSLRNHPSLYHGLEFNSPLHSPSHSPSMFSKSSSPLMDTTSFPLSRLLPFSSQPNHQRHGSDGSCISFESSSSYSSSLASLTPSSNPSSFSSSASSSSVSSSFSSPPLLSPLKESSLFYESDSGIGSEAFLLELIKEPEDHQKSDIDLLLDY